MPLLPNDADFIGDTVDEATFKAKQTQMLGYLRGLLGNDGTAATARKALGLGSLTLNYVNRGEWVTNTLYYVNDQFIRSNIAYLVTKQHVSNVFSTDGTSGFFVVQQGLSPTTGLQKVNDVTELRTINISNARSIYCDRHKSIGGGGIFDADFGRAVGTYVDNSVTIIVPDGGDGSSAWIKSTGVTVDINDETLQMHKGASAATSAHVLHADGAWRLLASQAGVAFYADVASGLAATLNNDYFQVLTANTSEYTKLYKNNLGVAQYITTYPSAELITSLMDNVSYNRSGTAWGIMDAANKLAISISKDGKFNIGLLSDLESEINKINTSIGFQFTNRSGATWGIVDSNNKLAIWLDNAGNLRIPGVDVTKTLAYSAESADIALHKLIQPSANLWCLGDSLTQGAGSTNTSTGSFPARLLVAFPNRGVINDGVGGQASTQIAERGGKTVLLNVANKTIPASGPVTITVSTSAFLTSPATTSVRSINGWLNGVYGTLTKDNTNAYSFTRAVAGLAVKCDIDEVFEIKRIYADGADAFESIRIFWVGTNDSPFSSSTIISNIDKMIASVKTSEQRYVILPLIGGSSATLGTQGHTDLLAHNRSLRIKYGSSYCDIRTPLINAYDAAIPQDVIDFNNDITPSSLRNDTIHLNNTGYQKVADVIAAFITKKGW